MENCVKFAVVWCIERKLAIRDGLVVQTNKVTAQEALRRLEQSWLAEVLQYVRAEQSVKYGENRLIYERPIPTSGKDNSRGLLGNYILEAVQFSREVEKIIWGESFFFTGDIEPRSGYAEPSDMVAEVSNKLLARISYLERVMAGAERDLKKTRSILGLKHFAKIRCDLERARRNG